MVDLHANIQQVRTRLAKASAAWPHTPDIIAVSKTQPVEALHALEGENLFQLGENRAQEIVDKFVELAPTFAFHCIGRLQTNKVKYIIDKVCMIQSLDRMELAQEIDRRAQAQGIVMPVLVQVNIGREAQKGGVAPEDVASFMRQAATLRGMHVQGLMSILPHTGDEAALRQLFRQMRMLFTTMQEEAIDHTDMRHLSMGMSGDYEIAAQEGATMVRIGSAIFGKRAIPPVI